ncbi:MAG: transcriptional regulator [Pseudohongiellaceae bacterium]
MYIPKHFTIADAEKVAEFLMQNNFGELISIIDGKPFSTHLPFLFDASSQTLRMHIAKANPQWKHLSAAQVLVVVNGPHGYISPAWYHSPGVPTWNYQAVHIYGAAKSITDLEEIKSIVDGLTVEAEKAYADPWQPDYAASMLEGIVGIELSISDILCKFKLSQNRSRQDQQSVAERLSSAGNIDLATAMENENQPTS